MDHVNTMLKRDADDVVLGKICADRRETLSDLIGFIGLQYNIVHETSDSLQEDEIHTF